MPTRNVNLTVELDHFVRAKVESGRFENASEVVRAALRQLERDEQEFDAKIVALRSAQVTRSEEQDWIRANRAEYAGAWVALEGARLVAKGSSARQVLDIAKQEGCEQPLVVHIPSEPSFPFGGW